MKRIYFFLIALLHLPIVSNNKRSIKILMVVATFPKIHDVCILNHITGLLDRGHDVDIYAFHKGDCENIQEEVATYNLLQRTFFTIQPHNLNDYDIIMFQLGHKLIDVKKKYDFKGKIVVCLRGYDITGYIKENPHAYDAYFQTCDLFLPVCEEFKKTLENLGCNPKKIIVHHSSIDCSRFTFNPKKIIKYEPINIVSAGRFVEKKGFIYAIHAIARLVKKYPHIRYTIIGDGPLKNEYNKLIRQLKMEDTIKIESWYPHDEYIHILNNSHIFVLSSVTAQNNDQEGIPNVLKEAMAIGLPVVATNHSGNSELITHGLSGLLVPERDSNALYKALKFIINNPKKVSSMQQNAVKKIHQEFEREKENDSLEGILLSIVSPLEVING